MSTLEKLVLCTAMVFAPMSGCTGKSVPEVPREPITKVNEVKAPDICASQTRIEIGNTTVYNSSQSIPFIYCKDKDQRDLACAIDNQGDYLCYTLRK